MLPSRLLRQEHASFEVAPPRRNLKLAEHTYLVKKYADCFPQAPSTVCRVGVPNHPFRKYDPRVLLRVCNVPGI